MALGSKTGYPLWVGEKAQIRAFFLSRSALSLFFALFFLRAFALLFCLCARERESAKKAPAPTSAENYWRSKVVSTYQSHVVLKDTLAGSFLTFIQHYLVMDMKLFRETQ